MILFPNDPIPCILRAATNLMPDTLKIDVRFNKDMQGGDQSEFSCGKKEGPVIIFINPTIQIGDLPMLLARELARAIANPSGGYGKKWKDTYDTILKNAMTEYNS